MTSTFEALDLLHGLPVLALVLFRLSGFFLIAPLFSSSLLPVQLRAAFVVVLGTLAAPVVWKTIPEHVTTAQAMIGGIGEVVIGMAIGFSVSLLASGMESAGLIVGQQGGFALGEVFNPALEEQTSITGQLFNTVFILVFLIVGGHRAALSAVLDTFRVIPPLSFRADEQLPELLLGLLSASFGLALRMAGPVLVALFLTECALAVLSRAIPQLNILTIGFATRAMVGTAVAAAVLGACGEPLAEAVHESFEAVRAAFFLPAGGNWVP